MAIGDTWNTEQEARDILALFPDTTAYLALLSAPFMTWMVLAHQVAIDPRYAFPATVTEDMQAFEARYANYLFNNPTSGRAARKIQAGVTKWGEGKYSEEYAEKMAGSTGGVNYPPDLMDYLDAYRLPPKIGSNISPS